MNKNILEAIDRLVQKPNDWIFRNGCCDTDKSDIGLHTVCVIVTKSF